MIVAITNIRIWAYEIRNLRSLDLVLFTGVAAPGINLLNSASKDAPMFFACGLSGLSMLRSLLA